MTAGSAQPLRVVGANGDSPAIVEDCKVDAGSSTAQGSCLAKLSRLTTLVPV